MRVHEILSEEKYDIRPSQILGPNGKPAGFTVFDVDDPTKQGKNFKSAGEAETFRDKENTRVRKSQGLSTKTDPNAAKDKDKDKDKNKDKKTKKPNKVVRSAKAFGRWIATHGPMNALGGIFFLFVTWKDLKADLNTFGRQVEKVECDIKHPLVSKAQIRFADALTANIATTLLAMVATGLVVSRIKKILMAFRAGALFAGPVGWLTFLITWAGAEAVIYGATRLFSAGWFHKSISDYFMNTTFTKGQLLKLAMWSGDISPGSPCYKKASGIGPEKMKLPEDANVFEAPNLKSQTKELIKDDPKLLALLKKAKQNKEKGIKPKVS
jgi:hypothetical protein